MKIEVEIEDHVYKLAKEILGDLDIAQVMSQMWGAILLILATHPEEFMAVFQGQPSPEQRKVIDEAMKHQVHKVFEKAREDKQ